jgi:dethiobiotin synthetase
MTRPARGFFVTGTDTGVGKTLVACALLHAFAARGRSALGMKPIAAGREDGRFHDVAALVAASSVEAPAEWINPYAFDPPIAPHIAAARAGLRIEFNVITSAYAGLAAMADVVVVEGAGGYMIPLNDQATSADLARMLALPVVLVVGMRLGCLNHALLTRRAIAQSGLVCAGWVANCLEPAMPALAENIATLVRLLDAPCLGEIAFQTNLTAEAIARSLSVGALLGTRA